MISNTKWKCVTKVKETKKGIAKESMLLNAQGAKLDKNLDWQKGGSWRNNKAGLEELFGWKPNYNTCRIQWEERRWEPWAQIVDLLLLAVAGRRGTERWLHVVHREGITVFAIKMRGKVYIYQKKGVNKKGVFEYIWDEVLEERRYLQL